VILLEPVGLGSRNVVRRMAPLHYRGCLRAVLSLEQGLTILLI